MLKKSVALILSLLLIMQILPMSVFAEEAAEADDASAEIIAEETETEEEASIIAEDEAKRDENTKHYLLSDGSYNAVVYPVPIHYQKDGETEWDEIDNTLIEVSDENENEYFIPEASPIDVKFAKYGDSDNLVRYKVNGYEISWSYEDGDFGLFQKHSKMSKNSKKKAKINNDAKIPTDVLENIESSAQYDHFYDNVDIEYTVTSEGVKENIILNKKSAQNVFYIKYNIGKLTAKQTNERLITLYDGENAVVQIDAPYMTDAADVSSDAISFEIVEQNNGALRVCLTADSEWLNAEDREYPVTIDPYIFEFNEDIDNDVSYLQYSSGDKPIGTVPVGRNHAYGACRGYIKFQLPSLSAGDMVTGGTLNVYQFKGTKGFSADPASITSIRVNVSLVTTAWDESIAVESVIVGTVPTYSSIVLDTMEIGTVSTATLRTFNVGTAIRTWYNKPDENYGLCLYSPTQYSSYIYAGFAATDHDDGSHPPILAISYLNNKGLEDRWTYHTQSLGESGTSYVNDCTGNLVFVAPVCNTVGNNAPISVNLVYNGYLVNSSGTNIGKCGPGWRFDFQQQITPIASGTALYTSGFRYIYTDADGTDHYFKEKTDETNTYEDEEGLGLTLKVGSDGDAKYTLEFKSGAKNIYNANGNIVKICDADNNYYKYTYNSSNQLSYITDGFDRKLTFTYTSAGYFSTITDAAGRVTKLSYASPAKISKITYPDGAYTSFTYDSSNRLTKCTAIDGTSIVYGYPVSDYNTVKNRVTSVKELGTSGLEGNSLSISYAYNNYTVFSDNRNHTEKYVFDEYGRTVCIFDAAENGIKYSYTSAVSATEDDSTKDNNKLLSTAVKTRYVDNLLKNHSFENGTTNWYVYGTNSATATTSTSTPMLGNKAMTFNNTAAGSTTAYQKIYLSSGLITEGYIYTFSAYVKANSADSNAYMFINCVDTSTGSSVSVGSVSSAKITEITDGYKRISIYMQVPAGTDYVNFAVSASGVGITQFDCLQVEAGSIMNDYNLLENSSFEDSSSTAWTGINLGTNDGRKEDSNGGGYYQLYGDINTDKGVYQNIVINKPATDCAFSVSGYASANSLPIITYRYFSINIKLIYSDGTTEFQNIPFEPSVTTTQYTTGIIKPFKDYRTKTLSTVQIRLIYYRNMNSVVFNNLSVNFDETGTSYTYDIEGNVTSAADNANTNRTFTYDSANNLLTSSYEDNTKYTYEYYDGIENTHRLESATSSKSGIKMSYAYNPYGGVSSVTVSKDGYAKSITTSTEYSTRGNYVTAETDALGNRTVYTYNDNEGTLATVKDAAGNVTSYTYNANNDYLTKVSANIDGLTSQPSVAYGYNSRRLLTKISTNSLSYNFKYDEYNNLQSVYIGTSIQLIKNTYASNNGNLTESEYANEDKVKYTYDALDRVTEVEYTNDDDVRYTRYTNT
ncbi:MAG: RHS repeat protein, partial [Clostridia bacterium]|nr:RHS repeat protein [Clostridia bacterium]